MSAAATTTALQRIGVFGGAFDPPHRAHVALVQAALDQFALDAVHVLPTGAAWHKPRVLSAAEHRLAMTRLAFAELPRAIVDDRELRRAGATYTVDTLRELACEAPGAALHLIIGADQAAALTSWRDWPAILDLAIICVAVRREGMGAESVFDPQNPPAPLARGRFERLKFDAIDLSATAIRARVARGDDVTALVPAAVARYIAKHHLYRSPT